MAKANSDTSWPFWLLIVYILLFLVTRLTNITSFPLFIDETTHIYLADITVKGNIFAGLRETHKQTYIWLIALSFQFFHDPILAARIVSVLAGLVSGGICYNLAETLYPGRQIGYLALLFYVISPFAVLFDRMAMADSLQTLLMGASLLASFRLWRYPTPKRALLLGGVFAVATFNKGYAILYYPTPLLLWLVLGRKTSWRMIANLLAITYATASVAWILLFSIGWQIYLRDLTQKSFINASVESNYLARWWASSFLIGGWLRSYLTLPVAGLLIFTVLMFGLRRDRPGIVLTLLVIGSLFVFALTFVELRSRYLLPVIVPVSVMFAWGIDELVRLIYGLGDKLRDKALFRSPPPMVVQIILFSAFGLTSILFSYWIIIEPARAPFPVSDKSEYIIRAQAPSGYEEAAEMMAELAQQHGKLIFLQHALPNPAEVMLRVYLPDSVVEQMDIVPVSDFSQFTPDYLDKYAMQAPTFTTEGELISGGNPNSLAYPQLWQVASFSNPGYASTLGLYQWLLPPEFAIRWLIQGGDSDPRLVWHATGAAITTTEGTLIDWPSPQIATPEAMVQALSAANVEYILATPEIISQRAALFAPFITTDGTTLTLKRLPPGWRFVLAYPELNCQWCLFQLRPPSQAMQVTFGQAIELEGYDISATQLLAGEALHLTLFWKSLLPLTKSYVVFVHLLDANGRLVDQVDELPLRGQWPTNRWQAGDEFVDRHTLQLNTTLPPGDYTIYVGLYDPATIVRLPARSNQSLISDNEVALTTISVRP